MKSQKTNRLISLKNHQSEIDYSAVSDEKIVSKVLEGHIDLFEIIVRRYNQQLFRIIRSYLSDDEDVKDVMQTTYLKAYDKLHQFRAEARFSTWLIRVAINEALKFLNLKKKVSELHAVTENHNNNQIDKPDTITPEEKAITNDMNNFIKKAIDQLPDLYRNVFVMREIEQMSTKETAECLGITQTNVKVRFYRSKQMLKKGLLKMVPEADLFRFRGDRCDAMTESVMGKIKE